MKWNELLLIFNKVIEKLFLIRFTKFLSEFQLLSDWQYGFRKGKSTIDAVVRFISFITQAEDNREQGF